MFSVKELILYFNQQLNNNEYKVGDVISFKILSLSVIYYAKVIEIVDGNVTLLLLGNSYRIFTPHERFRAIFSSAGLTERKAKKIKWNTIIK